MGWFMKWLVRIVVAIALVAVAIFLWIKLRQPRPGHVKDEPLLVGRDSSTLPAADED
jgi:hypothetical protein